MRNLFLFNMVSLDGFFEGPNRDINWHTVDDEFNDFAVKQLDAVDTLVFGRVTYELMASYWPTPAALEDDPLVARRMNEAAKIVVSRTLSTAEWANTRVVQGDVAGAIADLKRQPGQEIAIFGSAKLAASLFPMGFIDELRLMVSPILLGSGTPLFQGYPEIASLELTDSRVFGNGNVLLVYRFR